MSHLEPERLVLLALGEGTLDQHETGHLDMCGRCRGEMDELRDVAGLGRQTQRLRDLPPPPELVWQRIRAELAATDRAAPPPAVTLHTDPPAAGGINGWPGTSQAPADTNGASTHPSLMSFTTTGDPLGAPRPSRDSPSRDTSDDGYGLRDGTGAGGRHGGGDIGGGIGSSGPGIGSSGRQSGGGFGGGQGSGGFGSGRRQGSGDVGGGPRHGVDEVGRRRNARRRSGGRAPGWGATAGIAVAAAVVAAIAAVAGTALVLRDEPPVTTVAACPAGSPRVSLEALPGAPAGAGGFACLVNVDGERKLLVHAEGMPNQPDGDYEAWLLDSTSLQGPALRMQALGIMGTRADQELTVPGTLDLNRFNIVDISAEPHDGDATHSGRSLLRGTLP